MTTANKSDATWLAAMLPTWQSGVPLTADSWQRIGDLAYRLSGRVDTRMVPRTIRVRLYRAGTDDPEADTDAGLPADAQGTWQVAGLTTIPAHLVAIATDFHAPLTVTGLDSLDLERRIRGLRPTLSRRGGSATLRQSYMVGGDTWLARVDVQTI